jgi:hypothetical protein
MSSTSEEKAFLSEKVARKDLIKVKVLSSPRPQCFRASVEHVYSARRGIDASDAGSEIEFVGCPTHWGQVPLSVGDLALVFVSRLPSGVLYEDAWQGHMWIDEIDGEVYAVFPFYELWSREAVPPALREFSRPSPNRVRSLMTRLDVMERYLQELIQKEGVNS